jgi:hypothetical protein
MTQQSGIPITNLPSVTDPSANDIVPIVHAGVTSQATLADIFEDVVGSITGVTAGTGLSGGGTTGTVEVSLTVPVSIADGGTGSTTQNFVDLTDAQTVAGIKTFSSPPVMSGASIEAGTTPASALAVSLFPYAITKFSTSGTFTTPSNSSTSTLYRFRIVGGGGGGGGANGGTFAIGGGGGAGAYAEGVFSGVGPSTAITITVGTGGAGGTNANGSGGNSSTIGSPVSITCAGGSGGTNGTSSSAGTAAGGGAGGTVTVGSPAISFSGSAGSLGVGITASLVWIPPSGGGTPFGETTAAFATGGTAGLFPGNGGAGAAISTSAVGGAGAAGIVIIERMTP